MNRAGGRSIGRRLGRLEDRRLLTGRGRYVDDLPLDGALYASVVRSRIAHGLIRSVDDSLALALDGVAAVVSASDLVDLGIGEMPVSWVHPGQRATSYPLLATLKVLYVGQPIAVVLADSPYLAEDAAGRVRIDYQELPPVVDCEAALRPDAVLLHDGWEANVLVEATVEGGDVDAAFEAAAVTLSERFEIQRLTGSPIETRAAAAGFDPAGGGITLWTSTQLPHFARTVICQVCGWSEQRLRVIAPDVGGGFGPKDHAYPEDVLVCVLADRFRRPVKWVEDRREHFLATVHSREQVWEVELAATARGELVGVRGTLLYDLGGHTSNHGIGPARVSADMLLGPYRLRDYRMRIVGVVTNKVPIGAYRGFGAPQATFVMEGLIDGLAREVGADRAAIRRLNMIGPDEFPYRTAAGHVYDGGDYAGALDRALDLVGYSSFPARREEARREGRYLGLGIASFVQAAGLAPSRVLGQAGVSYAAYESIAVRMDPTGKVTLFVPSSSQGQGHATTLAQVCADRLGLDPASDVVVVQGDTALTPYSSASAISSRVASVAGAAVLRASDRLRARLCRLAAHVLEASEADIDLVEGMATVRGSPTPHVSIGELAARAYQAHDLPEGLAPGLEDSDTFDPPGATYPYGTHVAVVEVEPETGSLSILRYVVVNDCGTLINPTIVEGQIAGGVAQGIGGAVYEKLVYDESGQLVTTSFMDYLLPTAPEIPPLEVEHIETPAPHIPGGAKGAGEAGTLAPAAVLAGAVGDALGTSAIKLPLDPEAVWTAVNTSRARGVPSQDAGFSPMRPA